MTDKFVCGIIVAAGNSTRMGLDVSKQFIPLHGLPVIEYTIKAFERAKTVSRVIVVCRETDREKMQGLVKENHFTKVAAFVTGGASRSESVQNGILAAGDEVTHYAIHDGARPLIQPDEIDKVVLRGIETGAAALGVEVTDTVKIVNEQNIITATPERAKLRAMQTPQVFEKNIYRSAMEQCKGKNIDYTDDCLMVEQTGTPVEVVPGAGVNIKLTTPADIAVAECILSRYDVCR